MDDAVRAREAARAALDDVEPTDLRAAIDGRLADASMTPAVLTFVCARGVDEGFDTTAPGVVERAVGVQLIYEGLRLTRRLVADEPWTRPDLDAAGDIAADLDILAADVLVSRGFYLLAATEAADRAVEVIRAFGRDQTTRAEGFDAELEADVCALAAWAGTTAADGPPRDALVAHLDALGRRFDGSFPDAATALDGPTRDRVGAVATGDRPADTDGDRLARSARES
jgi:hypothetical protein